MTKLLYELNKCQNIVVECYFSMQTQDAGQAWGCVNQAKLQYWLYLVLIELLREPQDICNFVYQVFQNENEKMDEADVNDFFHLHISFSKSLWW